MNAKKLHLCLFYIHIYIMYVCMYICIIIYIYSYMSVTINQSILLVLTQMVETLNNIVRITGDKIKKDNKIHFSDILF